MSSTKVKIYHNPRCSKSRQTLELLKDHGVDVEVVEYLKNPPDKKELKAILKMLDMDPRELMRKKEKEYKEAGLDDPDLTMDALINTMIKHPILIERPIVVCNGKAAIGRPPQAVLDILAH
jgi:arsenate reductase